jgi:p-cumate 2,3-dioxygenase subunit beta
MRSIAQITRPEVEDFLFLEAALLDEWRLTEWRALFLPECRYIVPNMLGDPYAPADSTLHLIADDGHHLTERVKRLGKRTAHSENPRSQTRRAISNVRIVELSDSQLKVHSTFITFRSSQQVTDAYFGRHEHQLVLVDDALRILEKRSMLDMGALRPHGRLSIIV